MLTGYEMSYREVDSNRWLTLSVDDSSINSVTVNNLTLSVTYKIKLRTVNGIGFSVYSPSVTLYTELGLFAVYSTDKLYKFHKIQSYISALCWCFSSSWCCLFQINHSIFVKLCNLLVTMFTFESVHRQFYSTAVYLQLTAPTEVIFLSCPFMDVC